ncbi:hypothetical protein cyc_03954 [Cyclospora cayetanensis]|uniref:Transmembrane protein n=1 Tax=Cyclospora cayetanensis TaxID=88456 RepID=A0A1D3D7X6_9EIME|nr:hypothetical protein cyc_03954 [Cyclospora cayetanensis]
MGSLGSSRKGLLKGLLGGFQRPSEGVLRHPERGGPLSGVPSPLQRGPLSTTSAGEAAWETPAEARPLGRMQPLAAMPSCHASRHALSWGTPTVSRRALNALSHSGNRDRPPRIYYTTQTTLTENDSLSELEKALTPGGWWRHRGLRQLALMCTAGLGCIYATVYLFVFRPLRKQRKEGRPAVLSPPLVSLWGAECLTHVGPYLLPEILAARIEPCPLKHLQEQQRSGLPLLQEEQTQALAGAFLREATVLHAALEALTRHPHARRQVAAAYAGAQGLASVHGGSLLHLLLRELVEQAAVQPVQPAAPQAASAAEDASSTDPQTPPTERGRAVEYDDLASLVKSNSSLWDRHPLYHEARALLLYRLLQACDFARFCIDRLQHTGIPLGPERIAMAVPSSVRVVHQCESNCRGVLINERLLDQGQKQEPAEAQAPTQGEKHAAGVLDYLTTPTSVYRSSRWLAQIGGALARLWSAEVGDLKYKALMLIQRAACPADVVKLQASGICDGKSPPPRETPSLKIKETLQRTVSAAGVVLCTSFCSALWRMETVELTIANVGRVGLAALRGLRGLCVLEAIYLAEDSVIQSPQYFLASESGDGPVEWLHGGVYYEDAQIRLTMAALLWCASALLPFLLLRLRDAVDEAYAF